MVIMLVAMFLKGECDGVCDTIADHYPIPIPPAPYHRLAMFLLWTPTMLFLDENDVTMA